MATDKKKDLLNIIALCCMAVSSIGICMNSIGVFFSPIAAELNCSQGEAAMLATVFTMTMAVCSIFTPRIMTADNYRKFCIVAMIMIAGSFIGYAWADSLILLYVFSFIRGLGMGVCSQVIINLLISSSFTDRIGMISGIIFSFSGLSGALFSPLFASFISRFGWRTSFIIMGILVLVFYLPLLFAPLTFKGKEKGAEKEKVNYFSIVFIMCFLIAMTFQFLTAVVQHFSKFAETVNMAEIGALLVSASMVGNIVFKLINGRLLDRIGMRKTFLFIMSMMAAAGVLFIMFKVPAIMMLAAFIYGAIYSVPTIILPFMSKEVFGPEKYAATYPIIAFGGNLANAIGMSAVGFVYDMAKSYQPVFMLILAGTGIALIMVMAVTSRKTAA